LSHEKTIDKIRVLPVKTPGFALSDQAMSLKDLAVLTGGQPIISKAGERLEDIKMENFGYARRIWGDKNNFGLSGGQGDVRELREHITNLRQAHARTTKAEDRKQLQERISKLLGGSATLWIGGSTESEIKARRNLAERTAQALRGAVLEGVLPGGGIALLSCRPLLREKLAQAADVDERAAYRILLRAVEEPLRVLASNAGYDPSEVMAKVQHAGDGCGFDLESGQVRPMAEAGIYDIATVQKEAVHSAIASAALALTVDVVIHRRKQVESIEP
jgi:chaperonin GroEL